MTTDNIAVADTDVASNLYRNRQLGHPLHAALSALTDRDELFISAITLGEARYGIAKDKWGPDRTRRMVAFYREIFEILPVDEAVADEYGRLRAATEALGRPVANNDLWIAATASALNVPLLTLNRRHFEPLALHGLRLL